jgi:hypothetical protein
MSYYRTPEHRRLRAVLIRNWRPWAVVTGPANTGGHLGVLRVLISR